MSKEVDKHKVFQTTRVRTALKSDGFWIQKLKQEDEEQDKARTEHVVETRPSLDRQNSYVLSTAKMFESVDCPLSPPHHKTQFTPSEGNSANQANGEVIPFLRDAQPEGSTVETTDDAEPQAPTEGLIQNGEAQPEISVADNVEHNDGAAEISAEVHVAECIQDGEAQPESSTKENPEAMPAEQPDASATAEDKGEHADATFDQSNVEHSEASVSADAHVEDPVADTSTVVAEVPAAPAVELTPQEEPSTETQPANATHLKDAGVESAVHPEEAICKECPPEQAAEVVEAVAEVVAKSLPDVVDAEEAVLQDSVEAVAEDAVVPEAPAVTGAAGEEAATQVGVESVPDLVVESVSELPTLTATETAAEESCETGPLEQAAEEVVEAVAEVVEESSPEIPAGAAGEEDALQVTVEPVPDLVADTVSELPPQAAAETAVEPVECKIVSTVSAKSVLETRVEEAVECEVQSVDNAAVEKRIEPTLEIATDGVVKIEDAVEPVECKIVSTVSARSVLETRVEEAVECEVQSVDNAAVETSIEPTPEIATDGVVKIEDAVEAVAPSDAEAVQLSDRPIELSEALDVEPTVTEAAPESLEDPKQSDTEETKLNTEHSDTDISDMLQRYKEELQSTLTPGITWKRTRNRNVCSFCDKTINGNVKIHLSEPVVTCHPDCLKCGVCARTLGDMLTPMFFHDQVVQCGGCFVKTLI